MEGRFYLLLLTDANPKWVGKCSQKYNLPISKIHQEFVPYEQIPSLLASADFAIAPFKQTEFSIFLSPVKVGEYLASGLPVILSKRLGDETERLLEAGAAIEVDFNHLNNKVTISKLKVLNQILSDPWHRQRIRKLAIELRNFDNVRQIYNKILE
jgi:glycosyltransferase involved in cell wall biosynthesis